MQLTASVFMVGSGDAGLSLTHPLDCSVYLIDGGEECALIDAGAGCRPELILEQIRDAGVDPARIRQIFLTHGHGDHAGGAAWLARVCGAQVRALEPSAGFVSRADEKALSLSEAIAAGVYEPDYKFHACPVRPLTDKDCIPIGRLRLTAIASPGHSAGHCCYLLKDGSRSVLFSGDAIQCGGRIALQAIWDCDLQAYIQTVRRLSGLHPDVLLPGHGRIALQRGWLHLERASAALKTLAIPPNSIGE